MKYGRLINSVVVDIATDPNKQFHPTLAAEFVEIPDHVKTGWTFDGTEYAPPVAPDPEPAEPETVKTLSISPVDFKFLFTLTERVKIKELRATDLALDDFYSMLDDSRLKVIDLSNSRMIEGVTYAVNALAAAEVVADPEQRISEILGGGDASTSA